MSVALRYRRRRAEGRSRGAALVELAIVAPLLFLLIFGVIEFGYAFLQFLDVRHGAREVGRLAAVNYRPDPAHSGTDQADDIITEACTRVDKPDGVTITIEHAGGSGAAIGQPIDITVTRTYNSITGFFDFVSFTMTSTVETRIEQEATWTTRTLACP